MGLQVEEYFEAFEAVAAQKLVLAEELPEAVAEVAALVALGLFLPFELAQEQALAAERG